MRRVGLSRPSRLLAPPWTGRARRNPHPRSRDCCLHQARTAGHLFFAPLMDRLDVFARDRRSQTIAPVRQHRECSANEAARARAARGSAYVRPPKHRFLIAHSRDRLGPGAARELDPVARSQLPGHRKVRRDDRRHLRVSARRLPIAHQQDRFAGSRHLDPSDKRCIGDHFPIRDAWNDSSCQPVSHPIRLRGDHEPGSLEHRERGLGEEIVLRSWQHPKPGAPLIRSQMGSALATWLPAVAVRAAADLQRPTLGHRVRRELRQRALRDSRAPAARRSRRRMPRTPSHPTSLTESKDTAGAGTRRRLRAGSRFHRCWPEDRRPSPPRDASAPSSTRVLQASPRASRRPLRCHQQIREPV